MSVINFKGAIAPSLVMTYQAIKVPGSHASAEENYIFHVANEGVFEFNLEIPTPSGVVVVARHATEKELASTRQGRCSLATRCRRHSSRSLPTPSRRVARSPERSSRSRFG